MTDPTGWGGILGTIAGAAIGAWGIVKLWFGGVERKVDQLGEALKEQNKLLAEHDKRLTIFEYASGQTNAAFGHIDQKQDAAHARLDTMTEAFRDLTRELRDRSR